MQKVVFIVGPTGVGKTALALKLAEKLKCDLVSADSVQVFKNLNIISGKDLPEGYILNAEFYSNNSGPSIYLVDAVEPTKSFSVTDYYHKANHAIRQIATNKKLPLVVGGTGLYIEALINGLKQSIPPDYILRKKLEKLSISQLQILLPQEILNTLNDSDKKNKRRLIRKIEVVKNKTSVTTNEPYSKFERLVIGLICDRKVLKKKINKRIDERINAGALDEAKKLFENFKNLTQQVRDANGYKQLFDYLKGRFDLEEAIYRWKIAEYRHAKNQMTWFRKYGNVEWYDILANDFEEKIKNRINSFLL